METPKTQDIKEPIPPKETSDTPKEGCVSKIQNKNQAEAKDKTARLISIFGLCIAISSLMWQIYAFRTQQLKRQSELALRAIIRSEIKEKIIPAKTLGNKNAILLLEMELTNVGKEDEKIGRFQAKCSIFEVDLKDLSIKKNSRQDFSLSADLGADSISILGGGDAATLTAARTVASGLYWVQCRIPYREVPGHNDSDMTFVSYAAQKYCYIPSDT